MLYEVITDGDLSANSIWLWGHGRAPRMSTLQTRYGLSGAVISAVDLIKGIGIYAGLDVITSYSIHYTKLYD